MNALFLLSFNAHQQFLSLIGKGIKDGDAAPDNLMAPVPSHCYWGKTEVYRSIVSELLGVPAMQQFGNITVKVDTAMK